MRILAVAQNFRQGWGGVPESIRLLAKVLALHGYVTDVFDQGKIHQGVGALENLPEIGAPVPTFDWNSTGEYDAVIVAGPWQSPRNIMRLLAGLRPGCPAIYLPRGGLARIEFARPRDLKKWPYLTLIERRIISRASAVVYSSQCELRHTVAVGRGPGAQVIIPDLFFPDPGKVQERPPSADGAVTFGFLAEIGFRKGLLPLVEAFAILAKRSRRPLKLVVGGGLRSGGKGYFERAVAEAGRLPDNARVDFAGAISHRDRADFYAGCDAFVSPSLFESFGLTLLEALVEGCPVVAAPNQGSLEFLPDMPGLVVARSAEPRLLADALEMQLQRIDAGLARREVRRRAIAAIDEFDARAVVAWQELLGRP